MSTISRASTIHKTPAWLVNLLLVTCNPMLVAGFWFRIRQFPNIAKPSSLHEKYLWRKIIDRNPRFTRLSDKILLKTWIARRFPEVRCARLLWSGQDIRCAPRQLLMSTGYLKANHASGTNFRLGQTPPDVPVLHKMTRKWLGTRWHRKHGEWGYRNVTPRLFIEEAIVPVFCEQPLLDLTVYVFGDQVSHIAAMTHHKTSDVAFGRFDAEGCRMALGEYPTRRMERLALGRDPGELKTLPEDFELPPQARQMVELSKRIAADCDHLRVDFLWNGKHFYLTEVTIYSQGGFLLYSDQDLLKRMAGMWELRSAWLFTKSQTGWRKYYAAWLDERMKQGCSAAH